MWFVHRAVVAVVQELMWRGSDPLVVLRLLVLLSYVGNGLPKKHAGGCARAAGHLLSQHCMPAQLWLLQFCVGSYCLELAQACLPVLPCTPACLPV
jgi:hypothetical protein